MLVPERAGDRLRIDDPRRFEDENVWGKPVKF
jgi:hypothetical protein